MSDLPFERGSANNKRISEIAEEIKTLSIELQRRLSVQSEDEEYFSVGEESNKAEEVSIKTEPSKPSATPRPIKSNRLRRRPSITRAEILADISPGDIVRINNTYGGNYGRIGKVVRRTRTTADVQLTGSGIIINKWLQSLDKVREEQV